MVFKTTRVGSIPATLVTLYNTSLVTTSLKKKSKNKNIVIKSTKYRAFLRVNRAAPSLLYTTFSGVASKSKAFDPSSLDVKVRLTSSKGTPSLLNSPKRKNYKVRKKQRSRPYKFLLTTNLFHPKYTSFRRIWIKRKPNKHKTKKTKPPITDVKVKSTNDVIRRFQTWANFLIHRPYRQSQTSRKHMFFYKRRSLTVAPTSRLTQFTQNKFKVLQALSPNRHSIKTQKKLWRLNLSTLRSKYLAMLLSQPRRQRSLVKSWVKDHTATRLRALALIKMYHAVKNRNLEKYQRRFVNATSRILGKPTYHSTLYNKGLFITRRLWTWKLNLTASNYIVPPVSHNKRPVALTYAWIYLVSIIYTLFFSSFSEPTSEFTVSFQFYQTRLYLPLCMRSESLQALWKRMVSPYIIFNLYRQNLGHKRVPLKLRSVVTPSHLLSLPQLQSNLDIPAGVAFPFLTRWATQQFYFFRYKKKIYLGLYLTTVWRAKPSSIHYMATKDQTAFKSALVFPDPHVLSSRPLGTTTPWSQIHYHLFLATYRPFPFLLKANSDSHLLRAVYRLIHRYNTYYSRKHSTLIAGFCRKTFSEMHTSVNFRKLFQTKLKGGFLKSDIGTKFLLKRCRSIIKQRVKQRSSALRYKSSWLKFSKKPLLDNLVDYVSNVYTPFHTKRSFLYRHQTLHRVSTPCFWPSLIREKNYTLLTQSKGSQLIPNDAFYRTSKYFTFFSWCLGVPSYKTTFPTLLYTFPFYAKFFYYTLKWSYPSNIIRRFYSSFNLPKLTTNITPTRDFKWELPRLMSSARSNVFFQGNITPWVYMTLLRFIEFSSGKKVLVDVYSFMDQAIDVYYVTLYRMWIPRFAYYERRLGHRFFLEEALHILHMSFVYQDSKLLLSWLKAIIQRISFWKTRFIFRFLKYLLNTYFYTFLQDLGVKGLKIKLKGKISVAGNSRKRTILYRLGKTSHATSSLKVVHTIDTIVTFTGVMGFQIWIFY